MTSDYRPNISTTRLRSFGRVQSRMLSNNQKRVFDEFMPKYKLDESYNLTNIVPSKYKKLVLEIGFGDGGHLAYVASLHKDKFYIGCEPYMNGVASLLGKIESQELENVRVFHGDVRILLEGIGENIFDEIFILFPDPWPKYKHHKKRLISGDMPELLGKVMKENSKLLIATDHSDYAGWVLSFMLRSDKFIWQANHKEDWQKEPQDWIKTKYQEKAIREGRESTFFNFIR